YLVEPKVKRVLVVRQGKLVGVVSRIDLLRRVGQSNE
ncbi:MAG: histidine kinase, partial [Nitrospinota bacterium]